MSIKLSTWRWFALLAVGWLGLLLLFQLVSSAADSDKKTIRKPSGIDKRIRWTTSQVKGSPDPPAPYRAELAFPKLIKFAEPLDMVNIPGSDRLAVAERRGKIFTFVNQPQT